MKCHRFELKMLIIYI